MQKSNAAEITTEDTNRKDSSICARDRGLRQLEEMNQAQDLVDRILGCKREEFEELCEEVKETRWKLRDGWLEASLKAEAQRNGLLSDHFVNFTDLFDAIIVKAVLDRLDGQVQVKYNPTSTSFTNFTGFIPFFALLQVIFSENERVLSFYLLKPVILDQKKLAALVDNCPEVQKCISLLMDSVHECIYDNLQYFSLFISLLTCKYPCQATLELSQFIVNEVRTFASDGVIAESLDRIKKKFPFLDQNHKESLAQPVFVNKFTLS